MQKPSKGWPRLDLYTATRKVGGSRRRGRNASNMWAADTLRRAQLLRQAVLQHAVPVRIS